MDSITQLAVALGRLPTTQVLALVALAAISLAAFVIAFAWSILRNR